MPLIQKPDGTEVWQLNIDCDKKKKRRGKKKWDDCMIAELCQLVKDFNKIDRDKLVTKAESPSSPSSPLYGKYTAGLDKFCDDFAELASSSPKTKAAKAAKEKALKKKFSHECRYEKWKEAGSPARPVRSGSGGMNPDHVHDAKLGGPLGDMNGLKWMNNRVNTTAGAAMRGYPATPRPGPQVEAMPNCGC